LSRCITFSEAIISLFVWLISHQPAVLFSQNKPATSNQPTVLFSHNKSAPAISHQPNEQAACSHPLDDCLFESFVRHSAFVRVVIICGFGLVFVLSSLGISSACLLTVLPSPWRMGSSALLRRLSIVLTI
jgi:hypothetical protein